MNQYITIAASSEGLYKEKGSKFIGIAFPITTEDQFKEELAKIKKDYNDARHHCYAFRLKPNLTLYRYSDDGEPNNSAGKPIFGQIQSFELTNVGIVVVRYFGGTKLGVGGLITAYREAAKDALQKAEIITKEVTELLSIDFEYAQMNEIMNIMKQLDLTIVSQNFELQCAIRVEVPIKNKPQLISMLELIDNIVYKFI